MPCANSTPACDWLFDPKDKPALADFFKTIKSEIGEGGNWDTVALQKAEVHMAGLGTLLRGGPKTTASIKTVWGQMKKTHESLLLMLQGQYLGASGWTYGSLGSALFANKGWDLFDTIHNIVPTRAKGMHMHNPIHPPTSTFHPPTSTLPAPGVPHLQGVSFSQSRSTDSQPLTDWLQSNFGSQSGLDGFGDDNGLGFDFGLQSPFMQVPPLALTPTSSSVVSAHGPTAPAAATTSQVVVPATLSAGVECTASDDLQTSWSSKYGKTSGLDTILSLGKSADNIGSALRDCFMPKESSAVLPTKQVSRARKIAAEDMEDGLITDEQRQFSALFLARNPTRYKYSGPICMPDSSQTLPERDGL
ncbi:hypothetical protein C8J57DRAFT_1229798 [Mycena rebaudengoi]|nr:hypothetical protein C8J57DRAFT_1229798 [Mycena rebaudengoi]